MCQRLLFQNLEPAEGVWKTLVNFYIPSMKTAVVWLLYDILPICLINAQRFHLIRTLITGRCEPVSWITCVYHNELRKSDGCRVAIVVDAVLSDDLNWSTTFGRWIRNSFLMLRNVLVYFAPWNSRWKREFPS